MAHTQQHKDRISAGRLRQERKKREQAQPAHTNNTSKTPPPLTITLPSNPHRIERIITLGTIVDNMFPKTKVSQITEILFSVKRIVERGA